MKANRFIKIASIGLILLVLAACRLLPGNSPTATSSAEENPTQVPEIVPAVEQPTNAATTEPEVEATPAVEWPDPLDNLLALRSITVQMSGSRENGSTRSLQMEIDALGNIHLKYEAPVPTSSSLPEGVDLSTLTSGYELYVIDGQAYAPSESDPEWVKNPVDTDYLPALADLIHVLTALPPGWISCRLAACKRLAASLWVGLRPTSTR
jgi:hypothetical protein